MKPFAVFILAMSLLGEVGLAQSKSSVTQMRGENTTYKISKFGSSKYRVIQNQKNHLKHAARNYEPENLDFSGMNLALAHNKIYSIVSPVLNKKEGHKVPSRDNFLISAELDDKGKILEVDFIVNQDSALTIHDLELIEKAILKSVKIPILKPELYERKNYITVKFPININKIPQ